MSWSGAWSAEGDEMVDPAEGREESLRWLGRELVGPAPAGPERDLDGSFPTKRDSYGPFVDARTGQEVLAWTRPLKRYGVGVLFAAGSGSDASTDDSTDDDLDAALQVTLQQHEDGADGTEAFGKLGERSGGDDAGDEHDLSAVNERRPSAMALSFLLRPGGGTRLRIEAHGGAYVARSVRIEQQEGPGRETRKVYVRRPWSVRAEIDPGCLPAGRSSVRLTPEVSDGPEGIVAALELTMRDARADGSQLVTVALVNRSSVDGGGSPDERALFQCQLAVTTFDDAGRRIAGVGPYPGPPLEELDDEERSLVLLYRSATTYAVGHGCSATWAEPEDGLVATVRAEPFPTVEVPSITPDILDGSGRPLRVDMAPLAGLVPGADVDAELRGLVDAYQAWIDLRRSELREVPDELTPTAEDHLDGCQQAADRMRRGIELLRSDHRASRAFELMNRAILSQQLRSELPIRRVERVDRDGRVRLDGPAPVVDERGTPTGRGSWRPFQLAFILACLPSTTDPTDADRETVELIFFPTGGGKTEAYLGLAAYSILLRRLRAPSDAGVDVLMRYTLRLLTAQQFLRASRLICALEDLRRRHGRELGDTPVSIGIWLGRSTTPNTRKQALTALRRLQRDPAGAEDPFLVDRCPWCAAEIGPVTAGKARKSVVVGLEERGGSVRLSCPDSSCPFREGLPMQVVDEDIYAERPSLIIGTVDKFAMLTWRDDARAIFGIDRSGSRRWSPPNLIIQDELHLISGPLGSMVGLYESVIEALCTDERQRPAASPKIVTSTATIRGFRSQVRSLFAREDALLFPPHGLSAEDSFFARYATDDEGRVLPGRRFVGVHAGNHSSLIETQVAVMAALLQSGEGMPAAVRDPWWTQLVFFNTLRELGTSLSLLQSSVPMQLRALESREGLDRSARRPIRRVIELTSRLRNDEVPRAIAALETPASAKEAVDVCLASNIIEVGIDIDRLSLMVIVGQPKTTSQYIQVTGRVGRRWWERPGLIVTLLNPGRPRDRSHYERFRSYHERLYAQVEPTSVTPFSPSAVDRGLHGALVAFVRQLVDLDEVDGPSGVPLELIERFADLMRERVHIVDPLEAGTLEDALERRVRQWRDWSRLRWQRELSGDDGLLVPLGDVASALHEGHNWAAPMSMRNVDAECELRVTLAYSGDPDGDRGEGAHG